MENILCGSTKMPEQNQKQKKMEFHKRPNNILRLLFAFLFLLVISLVICRIFFYKTPQEQLAAIDASLAIPDSENAAIIYNQLFKDYNESDFEPAFLNKDVETITRTTPWSSQDYPEIANWLEQNQNIIEKLMELSLFKKCYFPFPDLLELKSRSIFLSLLTVVDMDFLNVVKKSAFFLARSANNDIAEGHLEKAIDKYLCVLTMSHHFREQPVTDYFLIGIALGAIGAHNIRNIIINYDISEKQLIKIETAFQQIPVSFEKQIHNIDKVEKLMERISSSDRSLRERFIIWRSGIGIKNSEKKIYLRFSTDYHANLILIALKRYKDKTGKWPEKLNEIKPFLTSEDVLIDPQNNGAFVYKLKDDSFILYSTGQNKIDENGQIKPPADDWQIWPLQISQTQIKNTTSTQADPNEKIKE
ncbi:MAG: hypothetical protein JW787_14780 [Sedimentisphaerales bacterium]|nr:hypothetical protein [Sedimentisphaerales bacterium]